MTMILEAPYSAPVTTMILPSPELEDEEGQDLVVNFKLSINGTRATYVKSSDRRTLNYTWQSLGRGKIVEIEEFFKIYVGGFVKLTDFRGDQWKVIFSENPISASMDKRSFNSGGGRKESGSVTLEFLGTKV